MRAIRHLDRLDRPLRIPLLAAREGGDADPLRRKGDLSHRLEVALRGGWEAGLDHIDLELGELPGDLQFLGNGQAGSWRLLTIAQRRIEDTYCASDDAWPRSTVHLAPPFSAAPCAPSMSTSTGFKKVI